MVDLEELKKIKVPKAMIKKMFPPKKSLYTLDTTGDGSIDSVKVSALNVFMPLGVPSQETIGDVDIDALNPSDYGTLLLDGEEIDISKDSKNVSLLKDSLKVYHKDEVFSIEDILAGKMEGRTIAMGDEISVVFKLDESVLSKLTKGKHTLTVESDKIPTLEIGFELTDKNMNQTLS
ncbi:MAG: hypothetical protein GF383_16560 [Candidatus Lokiarchaeota archaeon]|nr:hypothetical protein [Candidatus Lokiarchaeota archaeon]MBD3343396.1 hypothetical protein [Candidatus Lokiarchaeota archaeon]